MKINLKINLFIIAASLVLFSCTKEDTVPPAISTFSSQNSPNASGIPGELLKIEGTNLSGLKEIILDNKSNISFNSNLNSDIAIFFNIPNLDVTNPFKFGVQPIKFVTANGVVESQINIIQPKPTVATNAPATANPAVSVTLTGTWFYDVKSVTFDGVSIDYTLKSIKDIALIVPDSYKKKTADIVVTTAGGVSNTYVLNVKQIGPQYFTISDFDGNGSRLDWGNAYGDMATWTQLLSANGVSGKYAQMTWAGAKANGYNGYSTGGGAPFLEADYTDAKVATLEFDYYTEAIGTNIAIQTNTIGTDNWGLNMKSTATGWQKASISLVDFVTNYGWDPKVKDKDINPAKISEIKFGFAQGDTPNPSVLRVDNIKLIYILK